MKNPYFSLISTVWHYGKPWRYCIVGYYLAYNIIAQGMLGLAPYAFGRAIDVLQDFKPTLLRKVVFWLAWQAELLWCYYFGYFMDLARVIERNIALKVQQTYRLNLYKQLSRLPLNWHQVHHSGNIISRLNRASIALRLFAENQFIYIETIVKFLVSIGFLLWISVPLGVMSLLASSMVAFIVILFDRKLIPLYSAENEIDNHVGAVLFDYISNMTTILTLRLGELTHANLLQRMMAVWPYFRKDSVLNETKWFIMMMLLSIIQASLLIGYMIHTLDTTGAIMFGLVLLVFRYQWDLSTVFHDLSIHYSELVRMDTDIKGMKPILNDIQTLAHLPKGAATAKQWHSFQIKKLSFNHLGKGNQGFIFNEIDFSVKRGEKIALIGSSGGGKSTLLNILSGLYKPANVQLIIDNVNFDSLEPLQAITTLIPQDPEIFENTITFNITMDLPTTDDEITKATDLACFSPVINKMPLGLETDIREKGLNLSVGQKQRLALARGLFAARFSSLILMDEPTSSVDLPTEKEILSAVIQALPDTAMIVSLHRLHLLPQFDSVIMLKNGKVIANGSTAQLLHEQGPVRDLWTAYSR